MTIGQRIKQLREKRGFSQRSLAKQAEIPQPVIQRFEAGSRNAEHMSVLYAKRLARVLGVSVDYLIGMYEDEEKDESAEGVAAHRSPKFGGKSQIALSSGDA